MAYRVGVDIGGTFIDFCILNAETNEHFTLKVLTTPSQPGSEIVAGLRIASERHGFKPSDIVSFIHGTTVGVNTIIQRCGARLALLTTENFEDILALGRLRLPETFNLLSHRPKPLIPRSMIFPVRERISARGEVTAQLDEDSVAEAIANAKSRGAQGIVVSFLNAFRNPVHERRVCEIIERTDPEIFAFSAAEVWPVIREYERTATGVVNAYVHPRVASYISALQSALMAHDIKAPPMITKSNGGVMKAELAKRACVSMLLSGTASGVIGAAHIAERSSFKDVLTLDIGGTSADVAVISDGKVHFGSDEKIGEHSIHMPAVSVNSIGEGGGSIAWADELGVLRVGPDSAGSEPGPACYGNGGVKPTITDAFAVCGIIGQGNLAYGSIALDPCRARNAMQPLVDRIGRSVEDTALAVIDIAISGMYLEISKLVARQGIDLRDFTLMAFGGAGPMLAPMLATELGVTQILIPPAPGIVSALGSLVADIRNDLIASIYLPLDETSMPNIVAAFAKLRSDAERWLRQDQNFDGPHTLSYAADMHYAGQSFEIEVALPETDVLAGDTAAIASAFHRRHHEIYAFSNPNAEINVINLRLAIIAKTEQPALSDLPPHDGAAQPRTSAQVYCGGAWRTADVYDRDAFSSGQRLTGPAIVLQPDSTTWIPEGFRGEIDRHGNLVLMAPAGRVRRPT